MDIREQFFKDENGCAAYLEQEMFHNVWNKLISYEKKIGKSLDSGFTRDEYIDFFHYLHPTKRSSENGGR